MQSADKKPFQQNYRQSRILGGFCRKYIIIPIIKLSSAAEHNEKFASTTLNEIARKISGTSGVIELGSSPSHDIRGKKKNQRVRGRNLTLINQLPPKEST